MRDGLGGLVTLRNSPLCTCRQVWDVWGRPRTWTNRLLVVVLMLLVLLLLLLLLPLLLSVLDSLLIIQCASAGGI